MAEHKDQPLTDAAAGRAPDRTGVAGTERALCFAMMPFDPLFDEYHRQVFVPAIEDAGLTPRRSDDVRSHRGNLAGDIRALVAASAVCMADLTGNSRNVVYEIGLAHGLEKPVVLLAQSRDDVPAELNNRRIVWYRPERPDWAQTLRAALSESLRQTLVNSAPERASPYSADTPFAEHTSAALTLADGERVLRDLLADGLSPSAVESALLDAGLPPSWVRLRVSRLHRRGW